MRVLLDTGPLVAMLYRREYHHRWSLEQAVELKKRVDSLMVQYRNVPISFADACLVCMAELQESQLITLDSDFLIYRTHKDRPLQVISP